MAGEAISIIKNMAIADRSGVRSSAKTKISNSTVELQWLEHLWDHRKLFETWVVRATEG